MKHKIDPEFGHVIEIALIYAASQPQPYRDFLEKAILRLFREWVLLPDNLRQEEK